MLGVRLEDRDGVTAPAIKFVDPEQARREVEQQSARQAEAERKRREAQQRASELAERRAAQVRVVPQEMFRNDAQFGQFDERGIPTHMASGEEVSKKLRKKLEKQYETQVRLYAGASAGSPDEPVGAADDA